MKTYREALHAMQTGVATEMEQGNPDTEPKHLRVGVNACMCDHSALVRLLIEKGILTLAEYQEAVIEEMNREVRRYEHRLSERLGAKVTLE